VNDAGTSGDRPVVAVGAVVVAEGALLLVQRARPPHAGRWSIPGGRVERGETLAAAVEREVLEETGLRVRCGELVGWVERIDSEEHFVILDFHAGLVGVDERPAPVPGSDAAAAAWVALEALATVPLVPGLEQFLRDHGVLPLTD